MTYTIKELALGRVSRLYDFIQQETYRAKLNLKGFDNPWLVSARKWQRGEKVLDIGAAYSPLPDHLQTTYGVEMWAADDFGAQGDPYWNRGASVQDHVARFPNVKYILEQVGDPQQSSLPAGYFDVVYSLSTMEHIPPRVIPNVWKHMDLLLKPGGEMLHAIDMAYPSNGGLKKVFKAIGFDALYALLPRGLKVSRCLVTPKAFARLAFDTLDVPGRVGRRLSVLDMILDPDILTEGYDHGLNRIVKDHIPNYRYCRNATLLIHLKKVS